MTITEYQKELQQANEVDLIKERKRLFALIKKELKTLVKQQERATDALNCVDACINNLNIMEQDIQIINTTLQQKRFDKLEADENCQFDSEM